MSYLATREEYCIAQHKYTKLGGAILTPSGLNVVTTINELS